MIKKTIIDLLSKFSFGRLLLGLYNLKMKFLNNEGWTYSIKHNLPADKKGNPLPWFTYSSIYFLKDRLNKEFHVFEYGSGNSTLWFSDKVKRIVSLEHDEKWYSFIKDKITKCNNVEYKYRDVHSGAYTAEVLNYQKEFDIIIIDGRERVKCSMNAVSALKENGVIVWDNSDRVKYNEGYQYLLSNGFKRIDFRGLGPANPTNSCTSVFYRTTNCLEI